MQQLTEHDGLSRQASSPVQLNTLLSHMSPKNHANDSQMMLYSAQSNSKFQKFIKQTVKIDLFNLTYEDEVLTKLLKDFIPRSDIFMNKPATTPQALSQSRVDRDRSAPKGDQPLLSVGAGDRKYRKSKKLEYTTQLVEALIKAMGSYSLKLKSEH